MTSLTSPNENVALLFRPKIEEKEIRYTTHIDSRISSNLLVDIHRVKQVLSNLLGNALKFTPKGQQIDFQATLISETPLTQEIRFSIQDSGIGIPKERHKKIFEPFAQADSSTTRVYGGTGLGLSISVAIVEAMGGEIALQSQEGEGSKFSFCLTFKKAQKL